MTDPSDRLPDEGDDENLSDHSPDVTPDGDPPPPEVQPSALPSGEPSSESAPAAEEGLPEWEPLTPELVEDEAIRGDFMLRWAVILLALLMGWTVVQETAVLTHIRSGEALASGGLLPTGRDTLASTTAETRWIHLAWLFDAGLAGLYAMLGETGLTIFKALCAAVIFYILSRISLPEVPTWWGSVCAALALVACFPSLTATPHIVTLLGMAVLLWLLHRESLRAPSGFPWPIVVTVLIWNQLDDRAWIGTCLLLAYALGHQWDLKRSSSSPEARQPGGSLLPVAIVSLLVLLLHPFLWESWLSAARLYQFDYPTGQIYAITGEMDHFRYFPAWSREYWNISYFNGAAFLLWLVTVVVLILNAADVRFSHLAAFVAMSLIAAAGGTELAVASIVFAALASLNAQQWYVANFRQTYSVETSELLFSRGGRALTVMALFGLGFMMVAGHVTGPGGRRVGIGFSNDLRQTIDSFRNVLAETYDDRPFSFRPAQGDVLNWIDAHPFIDSRLRLFAAASPSIVDEHLQARAALRIPRDGSPEQRETWQAILDKYEINQALPRLSGATPDYTTFYDLLSSSAWVLTRLGADTAAFCRTDRTDPDLAEYVEVHQQGDLVQSQLRIPEADAISGLRPLWPQSPSVYSRYFYQPTPAVTPALQRGRHYLGLSQRISSVNQVVAALYAAVRDVHRGLVEAPSDRDAYLVLGRAYETLWAWERGVMQQQQQAYPGALRYAQSVSAFHQAILCDPTAPEPHFRLVGLYAQQQRHDLALRSLQEFERLTGRLTLLTEDDPRFAESQAQMEEYLADLTLQVSELRSQNNEDLAAGIDPANLVAARAENGYPLMALEIIESDRTMLSGNPELGLLYARLLQECGRVRDAYDQFQGLTSLSAQGQLPEWPMYAAISQVAAEDLFTALETLQADQSALASTTALALLYQHPLLAPGPSNGSQALDPMAPVARRLQLASVYFSQLHPRLETSTWNRSLILLELGRNREAAELLEEMLQRNPLSQLRPVAEAYLRLLMDDPQIPPVPEVDSLEVSDPFAEEAPAEESAAEDAADSDDAAASTETTEPAADENESSSEEADSQTDNASEVESETDAQTE